jgi:PleD family two-component response regulator
MALRMALIAVLLDKLCQSWSASKPGKNVSLYMLGKLQNRPQLRSSANCSDGTMISILLSEDDEAMRTYLARGLENAVYDVVAVDRGTEAMPHLQSRPFDYSERASI